MNNLLEKECTDTVTLKKADFRYKQFFYIFLSLSISTLLFPILIFSEESIKGSLLLFVFISLAMGVIISFYIFHIMKNARLHLSNEEINSPIGYPSFFTFQKSYLLNSKMHNPLIQILKMLP